MSDSIIAIGHILPGGVIRPPGHSDKSQMELTEDVQVNEDALSNYF